MLLSKEDGANAWQTLLYNLGRRKERPPQGFYTFEEKIEYWALIWGTAVMVITGFFLWNPITAARYLPGGWIPVAKAAHGGEALLAVLSILIWHMYHVFVRHFNKSMYTGYMSREEMEHEHPLALHEPSPVVEDPEKRKERKRKFLIGYGLVTLVWLVGVAWFVASEQTFSTLPEADPIEAYVPITPTPFPTLAPLSERAQRYGTTWDQSIGMLFDAKCGECHNPVGGENNLDLTTYQGTLAGGDSGPSVIPGAPGISLVTLWPTFEDHPGVFSPVEMDAVRWWIQNGAAEK
jgi:cytochrome b subunit of formate dehydrogenase